MTPADAPDVPGAFDGAFDGALLRPLVPAVIGVLVRRGADFATAEDAVQEALVEAWRTFGDGSSEPPRDLKGWLVTVAWRRFLDVVRSETARQRREVAVDLEPERGPAETADDTLRVFFLCAHPALTPASAVALTLRAVAGLTTRQVAEAYLVPEATMAQRISRAKRTVSGESFDRPGDLATVRRVLYLVFNEGYSGDVDLAAEAIRLTRQLAALAGPDGQDQETDGLLALMLLHHARRPARLRDDGTLVPLADQDRSRWDTGLIEEGVTVLQAALARSDAASTSSRRPSPPCTPTPPAPRRPTGCRWCSGTTSCWRSPAARSCGSTAPWPWARPTAPGPASRRWPRSTPRCPATAPRRRTSTRRTATSSRRRGSTPRPPSSRRTSPSGPT